MDTSRWRVLPDDGPLVAPVASGALDGETVAVKDLFAVAGQRVGAGNPAWLHAAREEPEHSWAVERLLAAGAAVRGIAQTEEFAWSLTGANAHYGTPRNPSAPGRISGGSSSGSAAAVAAGEVSIGLGTDTSGSIRVPAAYQGLWSLRPTHGAIPSDGVLPLAPSFDTVGWLTRDAGLLARVGEVLLPPDTATPSGTLLADRTLLGLAEPDVRDAVVRAVHGGGRPPRHVEWDLPDAWVDALRIVQAAEAWQAHGAWIEGRFDTLGPAVRGRFELARAVTPEQAEAARTVVSRARAEIRGRLGADVLVLPSASSVAPVAGDPSAAEAVRAATVVLSATAVLGGLPSVSVPVRTSAGLPAGVSLVGPAGSDRGLLAFAADFARRSATVVSP
ncbi:amidase family protein [Antribacter gilvus]|uniref:amidase family protein n=1 Tax=Antribacter gilvus TaxID=2304675 RepID=UPI001F0C2D79|nr:amidase family protein [Antribacter gilvus]